jgi:hypothetical protein
MPVMYDLLVERVLAYDLLAERVLAYDLLAERVLAYITGISRGFLTGEGLE